MPVPDAPLSARDIIQALNLQELQPEGGYWGPRYRAPLTSSAGECACGSILYLITPETFSHFHCLTVDEIFHFCAGFPVEQLVLTPEGTMQRVILGPDIVAGHVPVSIVPAGCWQAARLVGDGAYALLGATTVPAYTDDCVAHAAADTLAQRWPEHAKDILRFA